MIKFKSIPAKKRLLEALIAAPLGVAVGVLVTLLELQTVASYRGCTANFALLCGAGAAFLGALLGPYRGRYSLLALLIVFESFYCAVAFVPLPELLARGLVRDDRSTVRADAVFVFSSVLQSDGTFTPTAFSRLLHGLEVIGDGQAKRLILSELALPNPSYADPARVLMSRLGVKRELFTVGPVSNSRDEAIAVAGLFKAKGWKTVLAVTSPLHSRRACALLEHEGLSVICSPSLETRFNVDHLVETRSRLTAFGDAMYERVAAWAYKRRGWL